MPPHDPILHALLAVFADPAVDEVLLNGAARAWCVSGTAVRSLPPLHASPQAFAGWLLDFAATQGVRLDPVLGAAGGSFDGEAYRWHAVLPPLSRDGPLLALRRHRFAALRLADFGGSPLLHRRLLQAVAADLPLLIAGPTGSGKTSLLAALLREVGQRQRLVVVEATAELPLLSPFCIRLLERPPSLEGKGAVPMSRLIAEALRLRPDRLVIGEVRGGEAAAFLAAVQTGHSGAMTTIHATDPAGARGRLLALAGRHRTEARGSLCVVMLTRGSPPRLTEVVTLDFSEGFENHREIALCAKETS